MEQYELPDEWTLTTLGNVVAIQYGDGLRRGERKGGEVKVFGSNGEIGRHTEALTRGPTIIIGRKGSVGAVHFSDSACWPIDTTFFIDHFPDNLDPKFLFHFLRNQNLANLDRSTAIPGINRDDLYETALPLPPLSEQQLIVNKIELLIAQLRTSREALDRTPPLLKKFRQSVLSSAFRGELTERDPNDEPASTLLERIRAERHLKWEEELRAKGKDPAKGKYVEPERPDTRDLPELPEGWVCAHLGALAEIRNGVTKGRDLTRFKTIEVPYLRVANVQNGFLDLSVVKTIKIKAEELEKYRLQLNDILFTEGGDRDKLGRGTVWRDEIEACVHQNHIHCARLYCNEVAPEWISLATQLPYARDYFWNNASQTVNLASLNATNLKAFHIPLPPANEQRRIIEKVQALFAQAEAIERAVEHARRRVEKVDQAILARGFRGEL